MTTENKKLLKDLLEVKKILSKNLNETEAYELMTNNKSFCIKSLIEKELNPKELAECLIETLYYDTCKIN